MAVKKRKISKFVAVTMAVFVVLYAVVFRQACMFKKQLNNNVMTL